MEEFISEHGGVLISGIVSVFLLTIIFMVVLAVGNMDAYSIVSIIGE